ncbi:MAG: hypothetical protein ACKVZH_28265 [Blastocatellia bacterium]
MIYTHQFVWLHFPKCAGTKIEQLFKTYFSDHQAVFQDVIDHNDSIYAWHDSIAEREARDPSFKLGSRIVICSYRKLSSWLESRYNFEAQRSPHLSHNPEMLLEGQFWEAQGFVNHADVYIEKYLPDSLLKSGNVRFLRTEFFEQDFKSLFGEFLDLSSIPDWEYRSMENASKKHLPDSIKEQLYANQKAVYEKCPAWRAVDEIVYGL